MRFVFVSLAVVAVSASESSEAASNEKASSQPKSEDTDITVEDVLHDTNITEEAALQQSDVDVEFLKLFRDYEDVEDEKVRTEDTIDATEVRFINEDTATELTQEQLQVMLEYINLVAHEKQAALLQLRKLGVAVHRDTDITEAATQRTAFKEEASSQENHAKEKCTGCCTSKTREETETMAENNSEEKGFFANAITFFTSCSKTTKKATLADSEDEVNVEAQE